MKEEIEKSWWSWRHIVDALVPTCSNAFCRGVMTSLASRVCAQSAPQHPVIELSHSEDDNETLHETKVLR